MLLKRWLFRPEKREKYIKKDRGAAAIEFALVSPAFFLLLMGIFEVGAVMLVKSSLETAILQVSRYGRTGDTVTGQTSQQTALSLATQYSFGLVDPSQLVLTVTPYANFAAIPPVAQAPNNGTQNFGGTSQPVLYTLSYNWKFFTPLVGKLLAPNGTSITLTASTVVENEPF